MNYSTLASPRFINFIDSVNKNVILNDTLWSLSKASGNILGVHSSTAYYYHKTRNVVKIIVNMTLLLGNTLDYEKNKTLIPSQLFDSALTSLQIFDARLGSIANLSITLVNNFNKLGKAINRNDQLKIIKWLGKTSLTTLILISLICPNPTLSSALLVKNVAWDLYSSRQAFKKSENIEGIGSFLVASLRVYQGKDNLQIVAGKGIKTLEQIEFQNTAFRLYKSTSSFLVKYPKSFVVGRPYAFSG